MDLTTMIRLRRDLHRIPEPGFEEVKTQAYILRYLQTLPQEHLSVQTWRTGILVRVAGRNPSRTIGYRADMDGLPIQEETTYSFASQHPGFMHACGHDVHMTIALSLVTHFSAHPARDNLLFIFQPAEEGPGGAQPMLASETFQAWKPDIILALHIAPEYPVGTVATKPGILFANTSELFIDFHGKGGHAAFPHETRDMVVAASHFVTQLQSIVSRNIDPLESAVVTVGRILGGTKQNIIAETARLEGTLRTLSMETMHIVKQRIEALASGMETAFQCRASIDYGSNYCQVYNDLQLTNDFMAFVRQRAGDGQTSDDKQTEGDGQTQDDGHAQKEAHAVRKIRLYECREAMTGEDFGYFLRDIPGFMFWLGVDTPYGLHHAKLEPQEEAMQVAFDLLTAYIERIGA